MTNIIFIIPIVAYFGQRHWGLVLPTVRSLWGRGCCQWEVSHRLTPPCGLMSSTDERRLKAAVYKSKLPIISVVYLLGSMNIWNTSPNPRYVYYKYDNNDTHPIQFAEGGWTLWRCGHRSIQLASHSEIYIFPAKRHWVIENVDSSITSLSGLLMAIWDKIQEHTIQYQNSFFPIPT